MPRKDTCQCGQPKDKRATLCFPCLNAKKAAGKKQRPPRVRAMVICSCGGLKHQGSPRCRACYRNATAGPYSEGGSARTCVCGNPKSHKSSKCIACFAKLRSRVQPDGSVLCIVCGPLPADRFYKTTKTKDGKNSKCIECCRKSSRVRNIITKCLKYGVTREYAEKVAVIERLTCEICSCEIEKFHIDHCHRSGKFRGLLCSNCNSGIGLLRDDPEICEKAAEYLRNFRE